MANVNGLTSTLPPLVDGNPALLALARCNNVLMLQGPVGPFFDRLANWLNSHEIHTQRVAFHAGDVADCRVGTPLRFREHPDRWAEWLRSHLKAEAIDAIVLFGQARRHHLEAAAVARTMGVAVVVMEEGYVRPGYATMELDGVNAFSQTLQRHRWASERADETLFFLANAPKTAHPFRDMALQACRHYWHLHWGKAFHPHYHHHRSTDIWKHSDFWVRSWLRKFARSIPDHLHVKKLLGQRYFFVPLQLDNDSQITHHSRFECSNEFVEEVLRSFARHAAPDDQLVIRQHPHARASRRHEALIHQLTRTLGLGSRVHFLIEGHTPTLVTHAAGVVVINSTVGLQAIMRAKPLMVMGEALYKRSELCFAGALDDFWVGSSPPEPDLCSAFVRELIDLTQVPCNLYGPKDEPLLWHVERAA